MYLSSLAELALGSRLKALSDQFYAAADEVYRACGAPIESRWFPVLRYLWENGPGTVGEVAAAIGQTHSAVSQLVDKLEGAEMVRRERDTLFSIAFRYGWDYKALAARNNIPTPYTISSTTCSRCRWKNSAIRCIRSRRSPPACATCVRPRAAIYAWVATTVL